MKQCKSCKTEINDKALKCPHCQADQRPWPKKHPILTGIGVLIVIGIVISAAGGSKSGNTPSTPAAPDQATTASANPTASQTPTAAPQTLLDLKGSGSKSTQKFTASSDWDLNWTYDFSKFGNQGKFQVFIYNGDGSMSLENAGVNQLGSKDSGTEHYHKGGTYYLQMNSECSWTVNIKG